MHEKKRLKLRPHYLGIGGIFVAMVGIVAAVVAASGEPEESYAAGQGIQNGMYMQDITPEVCANTPVGDTQYTVKDKRDEKEYTVARIKNGDNDKANCWMTQNLAFDIKNQSSKMIMELSDVTVDKQNWARDNVTVQNDKFSDNNSIAQYTNSTPVTILAGSYNSSYGYYYSWCAATAGTCSNTMVNQPGVRSADMSICPKGWQLPTGGTNGEYSQFLRYQSPSSIMATPYNFSDSGSIGVNGFTGGSSTGSYWSSSSLSDTDAYVMYFDPGHIFSAYNSKRKLGFAVRCVAEAPSGFGGVYAMQDMTADVCVNAKETAGTLVDRRDNKIYSVAKIADKVGDGENCWMTSNLAFDVKTGNTDDKKIASNSDVTMTETQWNTWASGVTLQNSGFTNTPSNLQYSTNAAGSGSYKSSYGYYYSWCTATAGSCSNTTKDQPGVRSATMSICPKGWKLPTGGNGGEFTDLFGADASNSGITVTPHATSAPYNYVLAGLINSGGIFSIGAHGYYWSSSSYSDTNAYFLVTDSSKVWPTNYGYRYFGQSVRCVATSAQPNKDSTSADFSVTVNDAITLSSVEFSNSDGTSNTISAMPGQLATGSINVNVGSNVKYKITMNSQSPDLASKTDGNTNVIPAITTTMTADQLKTNYGWGVLKKQNDSTTDDTVYTGLNSTDQTFYTSDEPAGASKVTNFGVGVGVPPTIPADVYSTEVTITAIATE